MHKVAPIHSPNSHSSLDKPRTSFLRTSIPSSFNFAIILPPELNNLVRALLAGRFDQENVGTSLRSVLPPPLPPAHVNSWDNWSSVARRHPDLSIHSHGCRRDFVPTPRFLRWVLPLSIRGHESSWKMDDQSIYLSCRLQYTMLILFNCWVVSLPLRSSKTYSIMENDLSTSTLVSGAYKNFSLSTPSSRKTLS